MPRHSVLARLQQVLTLAILGCALAWLVWQWPRSPVWAVTGFAAIVLLHAWVLALEFALLAIVSRKDRVPRPTPLELVRAWRDETLSGFHIFAWRQPFRWRQVPDRLDGPAVRGRHGVVFIHGFVCNRGFWAPWMRHLQAEGRACAAVNLEPVFTEIDGYAATVDEAVRRVREATGLPPVLVCHSMGGLAARAWLRTQPQGEFAAAHVVTIGSPHRGTWLARFSHLANGRQMRIGGEWLDQLTACWMPAHAERFTCWYSNCDNIVFPPSTATLPGADNRLVRGVGHVDLAFEPQVLAHTLALLAVLDLRRCEQRKPSAGGVAAARL